MAEPLAGRQWFMDDEFDTRLPEWLVDECAQFYGQGFVGVGFAQMLAAFLAAKGFEVKIPAAALRKRDSAWMVVIHTASRQERCWCDKPKGHAGWLVCAQKEAERLADP